MKMLSVECQHSECELKKTSVLRPKCGTVQEDDGISSCSCGGEFERLDHFIWVNKEEAISTSIDNS